MNAVTVAETVPEPSVEPALGGQGTTPLRTVEPPLRSPKQRDPALVEKCAQTPLVPLAWLRGEARVHPEEAGERKAGRPRLNVRHSLTVGDLDLFFVYMQRRTRELQKIVRGAQPNEEHTSKIVEAAIKDAIRRLSANLPEPQRDAIDHAVAGRSGPAV